MSTTVRTESIQSGTASDSVSLRDHVLESLDRYFKCLAGSPPANVHNLVLEEVESALYEAIMKFCKGNQSRAAILLGVSRGTLRTKLKFYFNTTHVGVDSASIESL